MDQLIERKADCFGCGACEAVCAAGAISMTADPEGFLYPAIDNSLCTNCGQCLDICPAKQPVSGTAGQVYAVRCNDLSHLQKSSSGGAFSLLAQQVLDAGGLVCGAVFDDAFQVRHVLSNEIGPMRKSKYVQSDLSEVYTDIAAALKAGKQVLFTGTPCQCDAMRQYFGPDAGTMLILAALVCRGVQSPGLWKDYVSHLSGNGRLEAYCFRDKRAKNDGHTVSRCVSGQEIAVPMLEDPFCRLYFKCLTLRPSCYQCPYTRQDLPFDLTIGDFWGAEKLYPHLADGLGTSLVIARTEAGQKLMEQIKAHALVLESTREAAAQPALQEPAKEVILRKLLFRDYSRKNEAGVCDIPLILKKYGG